MNYTVEYVGGHCNLCNAFSKVNYAATFDELPDVVVKFAYSELAREDLAENRMMIANDTCDMLDAIMAECADKRMREMCNKYLDIFNAIYCVERENTLYDHYVLALTKKRYECLLFKNLDDNELQILLEQKSGEIKPLFIAGSREKLAEMVLDSMYDLQKDSNGSLQLCYKTYEMLYSIIRYGASDDLKEFVLQCQCEVQRCIDSFSK